MIDPRQVADALVAVERERKLGMTSRVKRVMLGVDQPVSGWLTAGMVLPYGQPVALGQLIHPQAEPEIAIVLGTEPAYPATVTSVLSATEAVFAAIEVIDSRADRRSDGSGGVGCGRRADRGVRPAGFGGGLRMRPARTAALRRGDVEVGWSR